MTYRNPPEPRPKTESPSVRWWDYLRYWVRVAMREVVQKAFWLSGVVLWGAVWFTADLQALTNQSFNSFHFVAWTYAGVWTLAIIVGVVMKAASWSKKKDRLER